jgi:hypothetical protein
MHITETQVGKWTVECETSETENFLRMLFEALREKYALVVSTSDDSQANQLHPLHSDPQKVVSR